MTESKTNFAWPSVTTIEAAKKASMYGVVSAGISATVTALAATWAAGAGRNAFGFIDAWAYVDAVIFAAIAYGIYKEKRWVAIFGLVFFLFEKVIQVTETGKLQGAWMAIFLTLCYIAAIRGLYSLHKLRQENATLLATQADCSASGDAVSSLKQ
ncbi:MAG: hypothetical protein V4484_21105 [Pseudomonadota bacterium]